MSFGRTAGHRSATGEYVPGTFSEEDELAALMAAMAKAGTGVLQVVPAGVGGEMGGDQRHSIDAEIEWITRLGTQYRIPLTFLAMVNEQDPHDWRRWFDDVHRANAAGANVRPQVASPRVRDADGPPVADEPVPASTDLSRADGAAVR